MENCLEDIYLKNSRINPFLYIQYFGLVMLFYIGLTYRDEEE